MSLWHHHLLYKAVRKTTTEVLHSAKVASEMKCWRNDTRYYLIRYCFICVLRLMCCPGDKWKNTRNLFKLLKYSFRKKQYGQEQQWRRNSDIELRSYNTETFEGWTQKCPIRFCCVYAMYLPLLYLYTVCYYKFWDTCFTFFRPCMKCQRGLAMSKVSVHLSVCPSVTRVDCDKTEESSVQIFRPHER